MNTQTLFERTQHWAKEAFNQGFLDEKTLEPFLNPPRMSDLILPDENESIRPLIVGFLGGTGVGKSSLLNRLAGSQIAKSGVERPTSREVTLFHHHEIKLNVLPNPQTKIATHQNPEKKHIVWIDMPDFDSTEAQNKSLVLEWLPKIDVLIYVVSPERYRDEKMWQMLLAENANHAWIFVFNQWDKSRPEQFLDFEKQLTKASFSEPLIFKTSCLETQTKDQFLELEKTLFSIANEKTIKQLKQRGVELHKRWLKSQFETVLPRFVSCDLEKLWETHWQLTTEKLTQHFSFSIQQLANYYADNANNLLAFRQPEMTLWDKQAQHIFENAFNHWSLDVHEHIPPAMLETYLQTLCLQTEEIMQKNIVFFVQNALANPGNAVHRAFLKLMRFCEFILPLLAMSWVSYQVFTGYYDSSKTHEHYLSVDFAVHSVLLCGLTWLIPFFILKKAKPSLRKSALNGLNKGLKIGLQNINAECLMTLGAIQKMQAQHYQVLTLLIEECNKCEFENVDNGTILNRLLSEF